MAKQNDQTLDSDFVAHLVDLFPEVSARDVKHLLRMALRVSASKNEPLTADLFRRCAQFRAVKIDSRASQETAQIPKVPENCVRLPFEIAGDQS